jgi:hypothetical protein
MIESATVSESLSAAGLDPMPDTPEAGMHTTDAPTQPTAPIGGRLVVTEQPGLPIIVQIDTDDGSLVREIALGPIDAIVFAHRLTAAALRRFGRANPRTSDG